MKSQSLEESAIYLVGAGAQTPVGRSVLAATAAVRCHFSAYAEHPFMFDQEGEPMIVARARWLDETLAAEERVLALAIDAAREALDPLAITAPAARQTLRLHLALSAQSLPDADARRRVLDHLANQVGLGGGEAEPIAEGHAGGLLALERAVDQLRRGEAKLCLVGGADSWLDAEQLDTLDRTGQLRTGERRWGFTPGEGAAFCLVTTGAQADKLGLRPLAELRAVASARERKLLGEKSVCLGEGLSAAFRGVLDPRRRVAQSYCDLNGETYRSDEYGFAVSRSAECFENPSLVCTPADCWGDVGAASGPLSLVLPLAAWSRGYARGPLLLAWSSSARSPLRAAALLQAPPPSD